MSADRFEIGLRDNSSVYKNGTWFFACLGSILKLIVSSDEFYVFCKSKESQGIWISCRDINGKEKWMLVDCSVDPVEYEVDNSKQIEYRMELPALTVRPSVHTIYYKNKEIYTTEAIIEWVLFAGNRIYILTNEYETQRNIHCIDTEGEYFWRVEAFDDEGGFYSSVTCKNGEVRANFVGGYDCRIDPETGKITDSIFGK